VDYPCPALTPEQLTFLDAKAPFACGVNRVINEYFPLHLSAGVRQYQYYQEAKYAMQHIQSRLEGQLQRAKDKEYKYLEKAMCVLSDLERANVLGRLLAHESVVEDDLEAGEGSPLVKFNALGQFQCLAEDFDGTITQSATDPRPNLRRHRTKVRAQIDARGRRHATFWKDRDGARAYSADPGRDFVLQETADAIEDNLRRQLHARKDRPKDRPHYASTTYRKTCFKCGQRGHIRAQCPNLRRPWHRRK
jgi:hypothetical protein